MTFGDSCGNLLFPGGTPESPCTATGSCPSVWLTLSSPLSVDQNLRGVLFEALNK